jgi:anthranilate phosphoribosyltransferase
VLSGEDGAARRVVLANAAGALLAADRVGSLREGVRAAAAAIDSGAARRVLDGVCGPPA